MIWLRLLRIALLVSSLSGCASYMHGYTSAQARNQYLLVDAEQETFGAKRIEYMLAYRGEGFGSFISEQGLPDYIYEFEQGGLEGANLFYVATNRVFVFQEQNWRPTSFMLIGIREMTEFELQRFGLRIGTRQSI